MKQPENLKAKVCFLGDWSIGKTSLIQKFVKNMFSENYLVTVGTRTSKKTIVIKKPEFQSEINLTLLIWDIMGQISFRKILHPSYFKGAKGAFLVCDLTREDTLKHLDDWVDSLFTEGNLMPTVFIANKSDLTDQYEFGVKEIERVASIYNSPFYITSAKTGENVERAFQALGEEIVLNATNKCHSDSRSNISKPSTIISRNHNLQLSNQV
jgi:small GTP-binding protein